MPPRLPRQAHPAHPVRRPLTAPLPFALLAAALLQAPAGAAEPGPLPEAPRFRARLQVLGGAALALPEDAAGHRSLAAYVPVDAELAFRVTGPLSLGLGGAGYLAPFESPACPAPAASAAGGALARSGRPSALAAYLDARFDFNNSRDGSWLNPWLALRMGLAGQDGIAEALPAPATCTERMGLGPFFAPRAGLDLWMGAAAVTFSLGYELLPRTSAVSMEVGLTLRLF